MNQRGPLQLWLEALNISSIKLLDAQEWPLSGFAFQATAVFALRLVDAQNLKRYRRIIGSRQARPLAKDVLDARWPLQPANAKISLSGVQEILAHTRRDATKKHLNVNEPVNKACSKDEKVISSKKTSRSDALRHNAT